jgi:hypothetical protein
MRTATKNSERGIHVTSGNAPPKTHRQLELDYLESEAQTARAAVRATLTELKTTLLSKIDPRAFTREHPRAAVGLATTAGITAGVVLFKCRVHRPGCPAVANVAKSLAAGEDGEPAHAGWVRAAIDRLFELGKAALLGAVGNALRVAIQSGVAIWTSAAARPEESAQVGFAGVDLPPQNPPVAPLHETANTNVSKQAVVGVPCNVQSQSGVSA